MDTSPFILIVGSLASLGIVSGGVGYLLQSFRSGSSSLSSFYKEQAEGYKVMMSEKDASNDAKFQKMTAEIGEIRGQLIEKEKQNKEYLDIINNRDPGTQKFQEFITQACLDQGEVNKQIINVLKEIHELAVAEHERDFSITATVTKSDS